MGAPNDDGGKTIKATDKAFTIIEYLSKSGGAGVTEIANNVNVSKSTVHNHLKTLEQRDYVVNKGDRYVLGYRFLTLGGKARLRSNLYEAAKPEINWLVEETGETACVATEECGKLVYLYQARGEQAVTTDSHVGTRVLPHCTALGKAMLAHYPEDKVEELLDHHGLPEHTPNTHTTREELFKDLETIRERGYAFDDEERIEGLRCVAAPIVVGDDVHGALSVSGPAKRLEGDWYSEELPEIVRRAMRVVEINLRYS
ncbi:IclR family transcriptional regulator [Halorussus salinisoli]|uniref:IclR family transcriptional regulator n=1 Tax=Halorussus salinisoli TaxID=2558242 RepID=UPI0010C1B94D|nr:IclR family transcriptional regulator [Halorussus salinisoli]